MKELNGKKKSKESGESEPAWEEPLSENFIVKDALAYIHKNYTKHLTLGDVAGNTYVSQWHLSKLIHSNTGRSFPDILNHVRIEQAKLLLKDPSLRIRDIAVAVGFLDITHFSRVFKKLEGISANEYRNQQICGEK